MEKIIVVDSSEEKNNYLYNLLEGLKKEGIKIAFLTASRQRDRFIRDGLPVKKIFLGPEIKNAAGRIFFIALLPFYFFINFFLFLYLKTKKVRLVICVNLNEKIILSPLARFWGIKTFWIENIVPDAEKKKLRGWLLFFYRRFAKKIKIISFNNFSENKLKNLGLKEDNIYIVPLGIKSNHKFQENIFTGIAQNSGEKFKRKFFTIGTVANLGKNQNLELIFQAVKKSLSVIPNLQLIIVGDGEARKSLSWLNKKMELDDMTWFVGEQKHEKKWLDSFDCFMVADEKPTIKNYETILNAMLAELPIIGAADWGLEALLPEIYVQHDFFIKSGDSEEMAQKIIGLWQDKRLREKLGRVGCEWVKKCFSLEERVAEFKKVLYS